VYDVFCEIAQQSNVTPEMIMSRYLVDCAEQLREYGD